MDNKKYTKRQIIEAINHWKEVLKATNNSNDQYAQFYCKKAMKLPIRSININAPKLLEEAISKSCIDANDLCVFNPNSYMNLIRLHEAETSYFNEKIRKTDETSKFIDMLKTYCKNNAIAKLDDKQLDEVFDIECYDPDSSGKIYGNVVLIDFPFDVSRHPIERHVNFISRKALFMGYNYVDHRVSSIFDEDGVKCCSASIQFEATYFSSNVKRGDILYHVAPKSLIDKILKGGLMPSNKNKHGFNYSPRVYCFIDKHDKIMHDYAASSGKDSKKFILNSKLKYEIIDFYEIIQKKTNGILFDTHEFAIFAIDTAKLDDVKFFRDNTFYIDGDFVAVYTDQAIKPSAISVISEITTV